MTTRRVNGALAVGALVGLALAGTGVLAPERARPGEMPEDAVAVVNGRAITGAKYHQALSALRADRREQALDEAVKRRVLERLIDDELLVQRGIELGLAERDPRVRADLGSAVIGQLTAGAQTTEPDGDQLAAFYAEHRGFFAQPARIRVAQLWFAERAAAEVARDELLAGRTPISELAPVPVPDRLLPAPKLRDYIGATATRFALGADAGAVSPVLPAVGGYRLLRVHEKRPARERPLAEVRELVRAEYLRRSGERALQRFLRERRERADIAVAEDRL